MRFGQVFLQKRLVKGYDFMKQPLISIITATYNPTKLIFETYHELQKQTYRNFEWIIIDDKSDDNRLLLDIYNEENLNIKIIYNKENMGPSFCRNKGANVASGDYLMFLDDDDLYSVDLLEKMIQIINNQPQVIVYAQTKKFYEQNNQFFYLKPTTKMFSDFKGLDVLNYSLNAMLMHHGSLLIPKEYFFTVNGYDERLLVDEDGNFLFKLFLEDYEFRRVEDSYHLYRQHTMRNRLSFNVDDEKVENRILAMNILVDMFKKKGLLKKYVYTIALRIDHIAHSTCPYGKKELSKRIIDFANSVDPGYIKKNRSLKGKLRRYLGCPYYYRLMKMYTLIRKILKVGV